MLAKKLLDLATEYSQLGELEVTLSEIGIEPPRTAEAIAEEYGQVLKQFLTS